MVRESSEAVVLRRVEWQAFGTLTFARVAMSERNRVTVLFNFLREVCRFEGIHWKLLLWAARAELGERGGRFHYHVLIGGLDAVPTEANCSFWARIWFRGLKVGIAQLRVWDGRDAVSYITKDGEFSLLGANSYEMSKFRHRGNAFGSDRSEVMLSDSLRGLLCRVQAQNGLNRPREPLHDKVSVPRALPPGVGGSATGRFREKRAKDRNRGARSARLLNEAWRVTPTGSAVRSGNSPTCNSASSVLLFP